MTLTQSSSLPLYAQIEERLAARIETGQLRPGTQLPSEDSLTAEYEVSRTTIRKTIENLARRGLVEIRRGKGTFVTEPKITQRLTELTGFVEDMRELGKRASARLIDKSVVPASRTVAEQLRLPVGTPTVRIRRVRLADDKPVSFDETFLPQDIGEQVVANDLEIEPIFSLLEQKYQFKLIEADYRLEAVEADPHVAHALIIPVGSPIFLIERTSFCEGPRAIDFERLHYRGDQIRFETRLKRRVRSGDDL